MKVNGQLIVSYEGDTGASTRVYASVEGSAGVEITKDKLNVALGGSAEAGSGVTADVSGAIESICGMSIGVNVEAEAGGVAGIQQASSFTRSGCTLSVSKEIGAKLLIGGQLGITASINPCCLLKHLFGLVMKAGQWVADRAAQLFKIALPVLLDAKRVLLGAAEVVTDFIENAPRIFVNAMSHAGKGIVQAAIVVSKSFESAGKWVAGAGKAVAKFFRRF